MSEDAELYPAWREALRRWPVTGFTWGDTIPHEVFYDAFNLPVIDSLPLGAETRQLQRREERPALAALVQGCTGVLIVLYLLYDTDALHTNHMLQAVA